MRHMKGIAAALALSTALLVGCGAAPASDAPAADAPAEQSAPAEQTEPEPEPAMSNWTENAFYERPLPEIARDLELLGFEVSGENSFEDSDALGDVVYYFLNFRGTPESNPVEGSGETVGISFTVENPTLQEGETEYALETIDPETTVTSFTIGFYFPETDSSEYEAIARDVADAVGLPAFTDSSVSDPFETGRTIGNFTYPDTFKGQETESLLIIGTATNPESLPDSDMPLYVSYGPYVSDRA